MSITIQEQSFNEKIQTLKQISNLPQSIISKLEKFVLSGSDYDLFRVNPYRFAKDSGISESESIDLFLWAAREGLFQMNWELVCPSCGDTVESFKNLTNVHSNIHCALCRIDATASLDDFIQITFTINPQVREISFHNPENLLIKNYIEQYHFSREARVFAGGPLFGEVVSSLTKVSSFIEPEEKKTFEIEISEGMFFGFDFIHNTGFGFMASSENETQIQTISIQLKNNKFNPEGGHLKSGKISITIENLSDKKSAIGIFHKTPEMLQQQSPIVFDSFLSGKRLLTSQTFRDLYRTEVIQGNEGINIKDICIIFTDLKGSTELYDKIGDLKAFNLVQQHFDSITKVITKYSGAIIKTIGDAVMASFIHSRDAVAASIEMLNVLDEFNKKEGKNAMIIKIGIHKGAAIAVTLNDKLDYFGQSVNIAARIQGLADAKEIFLTESVFNSPDVKDLLKDFSVKSEKAKLKGVQDEMLVYKVII